MQSCLLSSSEIHHLSVLNHQNTVSDLCNFVIMVPTYGGGVVKKAVPIQVKRFLNDPANREWIRGVIASGNTNFGEAYCAAGDIIAAKCKVPYLYRYELMGTPEDTAAVRNGLVRFFTEQ